ncbi:hypothetical protein [uncultured Clostridium sp.]|uniref:hypothetical protein n=1 Tax=uncultured Clostridium sp. TaxID=59620 RepID=UPI0028E7847F|nr:hypothetical protein [uncultured Clostridium sp.]
MRICPNCKKEFHYPLKARIFTGKVYKLRCDKCNTVIKESKKTTGINSIISSIPLIPVILYFDELFNFLDNLTSNHSISIFYQLLL